MKTKKMGFTLTELLVVIAILGIIAGLAIPAIKSARKRAQAAQKENTTAAETKIETEFPKEKILTISAAEYCESVGRKLSEYKVVGVFSWGYDSFQRDIPSGTEVVASFTYSGGYYAGTALIPLPR
ncbi:type II secretion system protein [Candidatus Pacearchaeota archaeon]|nr:type II secretion system protein [Candidatus Pacearchaeota archaeon]